MQVETNRSSWKDFLDDFSKRHALRPARIEIFGEEIGARELGDVLPFVGVSYETKGDAAGSVEVVLGGETAADQRHLTHLIPSVEHIYPYLDAAGIEQGIEIEASDGTKTLLRFEVLPELEAG